MKKNLLLSLGLFIGTSFINAQTAVGTVVGNFNLTDIDGNTHNLFDYLDAGKMVVIDVSATWCPPCWSYHQSGALNDFYIAHGPSGANDAMALFIEGDPSTGSTELNGSGNTQGNWVTGESVPIIDLVTQSSFENSGLEISYYPVMYVICPNRTVLASGNANSIGTLSSLNGMIGDCPPIATDPVDVAAASFDSPNYVCGSDYTPIVTIQNFGTNALTAATINIMDGSTIVSTGTYSGNLATYGETQVTCTPIIGYSGGTLNAIVTTTGDADETNGTISTMITSVIQAVGTTASVIIVPDDFGSETTWEITNSSGVAVGSGGPYTDGSTNTITVNVNLVESECYTFTIFDSYGDGIDGDWGSGSYTVKDAANNVLASGGAFTFEESKGFRSGVSVGIKKIEIDEFNIYPCPATSKINIAFVASNADYIVSLVDLQGRTVLSKEYSNLDGKQIIELPVQEIAAGNYLVKVISGGFMSVEKVVIN